MFGAFNAGTFKVPIRQSWNHIQDRADCNHPGGDPTPSEAGHQDAPRDLIRAGQRLKIEVLDHIILGRRTEQRKQDYVSLRELGYFYA